jgi:hypothetical protein
LFKKAGRKEGRTRASEEGINRGRASFERVGTTDNNPTEREKKRKKEKKKRKGKRNRTRFKLKTHVTSDNRFRLRSLSSSRCGDVGRRRRIDDQS